MVSCVVCGSEFHRLALRIKCNLCSLSTHRECIPGLTLLDVAVYRKAREPIPFKCHVCVTNSNASSSSFDTFCGDSRQKLIHLHPPPPSAVPRPPESWLIAVNQHVESLRQFSLPCIKQEISEQSVQHPFPDDTNRRRWTIHKETSQRRKHLLMDDIGYRFGIKRIAKKLVVWRCTSRRNGNVCRATIKQVIKTRQDYLNVYRQQDFRFIPHSHHEIHSHQQVLAAETQ